MYYVVVLLVSVKIILDTDTQSKALGYLFLVGVFPVVGIIVYFAIGVNYRKKKLYRKKLDVTSDVFRQMALQVAQYSQETLESSRGDIAEFYPLAMTLEKENMIPTRNNNVRLLVNGENKFPVVLEDLKKARNHIHIQYYIYENDVIGNEIVDILIAKVKEGVAVRFMYDDYGSWQLGRKFIKHLDDNGVETAAFYKIIHPLFANRINYRNHRKIIVVDGIVSYIGGINVSDRYINNDPDRMFWRDTHLRINGLASFNLQRIFLADWNFCAQQNIGYNTDLFPVSRVGEHFGNTLVQISSSGPDYEYPSIMYSMIQAILLAKKEVFITTPYFIPEKSFLDALKIARLSGVDVRLLVPGVSDSKIVNMVSNSQYQELLQRGIRIYKYQKGFVHAKSMVCDGQTSIVGTANLDQRSFDLNFEVNAVIYDGSMAGELREVFFRDLEDAVELDLAAWENRPGGTLFMERVFRLFSPLM